MGQANARKINLGKKPSKNFLPPPPNTHSLQQVLSMSAADTTKRKRDRAGGAPPVKPRQETSVSSDWGSILEVRPAPITARTVGSDKIWLVDELLSKDECAQLISRAEAHGFGTTHYEHSYRGNLRLTTTDTSLAEAVWARLRAVVPPRLTLTKPEREADTYWWDHYPDAEGEWEAYGLNECWRLAKYRAGDRFLCHCDEAYSPRAEAQSRDAEARMSMLSVNIYMNSGFEGGRTRFFLRDDWCPEHVQAGDPNQRIGVRVPMAYGAPRSPS